MIWCKKGSITSRRSISKFNVKVESRKIEKIKLLNKWEATLNNGRYCLTREKNICSHCRVTCNRVGDRDRPLGTWGIGTLSSKSPAYNLIAYHTGSVWSQDKALTALRWISRSSPHRITSRSSWRLIWHDIAATLGGCPRTFRRSIAQQPERSLRAVFFNCCKWC